MRNPNGYGSVVKLSGNRRKPYAVRKTVGWNDKGQPVYKMVGYCKTRKEANILLAEYNKQPWDLDQAGMTLGELYKLWCENKLSGYAPKSATTYKSGYVHISYLADLKYKDIRYGHMLESVNKCEGASSINRTVLLWRKLDQYAYELDIISKKYSDSLKTVAQNEGTREPFTPEEIHRLFHIDDDMARLALVYIYTGMRATELLNPDELTADYIIGGVKNKSSKHRYIPIHPAIRYIVEGYIARGYVYPGSYKSLAAEWRTWMDSHGFPGKILHECRHTFETELDAAGANRKCIDLLTGHASEGTGQRIYNHKTKEELRRALLMFPDYSLDIPKPQLRVVGGGGD